MLRHGACGARRVFTLQDTEGGYMLIYDNYLPKKHRSCWKQMLKQDLK